MLSKKLHCRSCSWQTTSGREDLISRLQLVGLLRRDNDPEDEIILALLEDAAARMTCPSCKSIGLVASDSEETETEWDDDWQAAVLCNHCRKPIPPERVEALPGVKQCVECQGMEETGTLPEEPDFCPRCGSLVEIRVSQSGGITRYKQFCTSGCRI